MEKAQLDKILRIACDSLYEEKPHLIEEKSNEKNIASHLQAYLCAQLKEWDIDTDYNREGVDRRPKRDSRGRLTLPDIIIHKHGPHGYNLAAIQIKGFWNIEDRKLDEEKLIKLQEKHGYEFLYQIELRRDAAEVITVEKDKLISKPNSLVDNANNSV